MLKSHQFKYQHHRARMSSNFRSLQYKSLVKDTFTAWREEEEDLVIVTKSGQKVSARSKILAFHSSLLAALLENLKHGEKATLLVDSTTEDVSTLLNLLNSGESSLGKGCMLGEVCGLAKSLGIQLQGVTVLNSSLSYQYDESYLLQENEDEPDIIDYIKVKEPRTESDLEWKSLSKKENNLNSHPYKYDPSYILQETKDEPDIFEYIEIKKHRNATDALTEHKVSIQNVNVLSIEEKQIVVSNDYESSIKNVNVLSIQGKKEEDKTDYLSQYKSRTKHVNYLNISEKKQNEEIVAPSEPESRTQKVNVLNIEINKPERENADCKSKVQDENILTIEVKKHDNKIVASSEHESRIDNLNILCTLPCEYDTSYLLQENEEEPDIIKYINKNKSEIKPVASTKPINLVQHPNVISSLSYEYDASYILQETEEEPDVIEFIEENGNREDTVKPTEPQKFVKSYTLPVNFNHKAKDEQHLSQLGIKRTPYKENFEIETKECFFCPKTFKSKNKLKFHTMCRLHRSQLEQAAHTGYSCNFCKEVFHFTSLLKRHITTTHKEVMQYLCIKCSVIFNSPSDIKAHIKCNYSGDQSK